MWVSRESLAVVTRLPKAGYPDSIPLIPEPRMPQQLQNSAWSEVEAQARIETARRDGATTLDLSGLQLRSVPESVLDLPGLRELNLSDNRLRDAPAVIQHLPDLAELDVSDNALLELPVWLKEVRDLASLNVGGNQFLGAPAWLGELTQLTRLGLGSCGLIEIPPWIGRLETLGTLDLNGNWLTEIPDWLGDRTTVTELDLSRNHLRSLPPALSGLARLRYLDVGSNHLRSLPTWIGGLVELTELSVSYCGVIELPASFSYLHGLTDLSLRDNELDRLPDWLGELTGLRRLDLSRNGLRELPQSLSGLEKLIDFNVEGNQLHQLPDWIGRLAELTSLNVGRNRLVHVPSWIGDGGMLADLALGSCDLSQVPGWVQGLTKLTGLHLHSNQLAELPDWVGELSELKTLTLYDNQLTTLPDTLAHLGKLTSLNLRRNRLSDVPDWIGTLRSLTRLYLDGNPVARLPDHLANLGNLERLDVSQTKLAELPSWVGDMPRLTEVSARGLQFTEIPPCIQRLGGLTEIDLSENAIQVLPDWLGDLAELIRLDVRANKLREIPDSIKDIFRLQRIQLGSNNIERLPDWLKNAVSLTSLYVSSNELIELPDLGRLQRLEYLEIESCGLEEVPSWVSSLRNLRYLSIRDNKISELPEWLGSLYKLRHLDLTSNKLEGLPEQVGDLPELLYLYLSDNDISRVPECLRNLTSIEMLLLDQNNIAELPDWIGALDRLTWLEISKNKISMLPESLKELRSLSFIKLEDNEIEVLPEWFGTFRDLTTVDLDGNSIKGIPDTVAGLENLKHLYLSGNKLTTVPDALLDLPVLSRLTLTDNPLVSPPSEIAASGTASVMAFLKARRKGASQQWASKLLVVGEGGVGKTSLIKALLGRAHNPGEPTTHAIQLNDVFLPHPQQDDVQMRLSTWDFGGQEIYHATHQFFLSDRSLFLLLWNSRLGWEQGKLEYWLDIIKSRAPESPVLLVATHADASQRPVDLPLDDLRREYPQVVGNLVIDNETRTGIEGLRAELALEAAGLPLMGAEWPTTWLKAAQAVKAAPGKHITPDEMWRLMSEAGVQDPAQQRYIAVAMHALGDILYYSDDPELEQTVVLHPEWVNEYISLVLDSNPVDEARGLLTHDEMIRLWSGLDRGMRDHFLSMMDKYEISFRVDGGATGVVSLVVERLPWNPPPFEDEWQHLADTPGTQEIRVRYQLNTSPPGIPTWFIARSHRFTTTTHWRSGALLAHPDGMHKALLRAQPRRNTVELTVRGPNPAAFFSILDDGFIQTLLRYPGLEIDRLIPCPCAGGCTERFDYEDLQRRLGMIPPRHDIECRKSGELLNVPKLLYGLAPSERDSTRAGIDRLTAMLGELLTGMADQAVKIDGLSASVASQAEYLQRTFLKLTRLIQDSQEARCPSVFAVVPTKSSVTSAHYEIRLYCEEPGAVHPLSGNDGCYPVTEPAEWLRKVRPHLRQLLTVLKHAAPLAGPVLGMAVSHVSERVSAELDAMTEVVDQIPELSHDLDLTDKDAHPDPGPVERASNEADFRVLESLLVKLDPDRRWGGLSRTVTPEGPTLYLCRDHADMYRRVVRL
jgi:internalin A